MTGLMSLVWFILIIFLVTIILMSILQEAEQVPPFLTSILLVLLVVLVVGVAPFTINAHVENQIKEATIAAMKGEPMYELVEHDNGEVSWEKVIREQQ